MPSRRAAVRVIALVVALAALIPATAIAPSHRLASPALAAPTLPARALAAPTLPTSTVTEASRPPAEAWLQRSYGLAAAQARRRLAAEHSAETAARGILESLGAAAAGAWLEPKTGELIVDVLVADTFAAVRAGRARPRLVTRSARELRAAKTRLDRHAARHGPGKVASWYVDLPRNVVTVEVSRHAHDPATSRFLTVARGLGDAVRIKTVPGRTTTQENLLGGQGMDTDDHRVCSVGFHATDQVGQAVVLTAGHCGVDTSGFSRRGRVVGRVSAAHFPVDDFAVVPLDEDEWTPRPWVDRYGLRPRAVRGSSTALVGSTVCKSGGTTGWTCGRVVAHDVTVAYDDGDTVYGLTQASTCSRGGDSGGPLMAGGLAQGMLSGGRSIEGECLERYGTENVAYFQPVGEVLSRYGLRLLTAR